MHPNYDELLNIAWDIKKAYYFIVRLKRRSYTPSYKSCSSRGNLIIIQQGKYVILIAR